jgi:hypothetical protein
MYMWLLNTRMLCGPFFRYGGWSHVVALVVFSILWPLIALVQVSFLGMENFRQQVDDCSKAHVYKVEADCQRERADRMEFRFTGRVTSEEDDMPTLANFVGNESEILSDPADASPVEGET